MSKIRQIQALVRNGLYYLTEHADNEAMAEDFDIYDVEYGLLTGKIRRTWPREGKYEIVGLALYGRPIGVVCRNYGRSSKEALRILPKNLHKKAQVKLARLGAASSIQDLREIRGNRFETLKGNRKGQNSIRINDQYRICFKWEKQYATDVEITDYH